jgi:hypothetical protein
MNLIPVDDFHFPPLRHNSDDNVRFGGFLRENNADPLIELIAGLGQCEVYQVASNIPVKDQVTLRVVFGVHINAHVWISGGHFAVV